MSLHNISYHREMIKYWQLLVEKKAVPHVINNRALTGEKPCIYKAIHAMLIHSYATFNLYRGHRIASVTRCVLSGPWTSMGRGNYVRQTSVKRWNKIVQEITRNVANVFSFYATRNSDRTWFSSALTFVRSLGRCWKPRPSASVFNTSYGTWRMLMHEKPCLIPVLVEKKKKRKKKKVLSGAIKRT